MDQFKSRSVSNFKNVTPSKAKRSKVFTESFESLRNFFVSQESPRGIPDTFQSQPALFEFATQVQGYVHDSAVCFLPRDSIQFAIIEARSVGNSDGQKAYKAAKSSGLSVLFDCFAAVHLENIGKENIDTEWASAASKLMHNPELLYSDCILQRCLVESFSKKPAVFIQFLMECFRNFQRRKEKQVVNMLDFILATHWTDSHHPLWLMQQDVINKICNMLAGESFTSQTIKERLRKKGFTTLKPAPIVDVELSESGVKCYKVSEYYFNKLPSTEFGFKEQRIIFPSEDEVNRGEVEISETDWKKAADAQKNVRKWYVECNSVESQLACESEGTDKFERVLKKCVQCKTKHNDAVDVMWSIIKKRAWKQVKYISTYKAIKA